MSPQRNQNLVKIYGHRSFIQLETNQYDNNTFLNDVASETYRVSDLLKFELLNSTAFYETSRITFSYNDQKLSEDINSKVISDYDQKIALLKKYDPKYFSIIEGSLDQLNSINAEPIYFIYSFAKLDHGLLSTRQWWRESSDVDDYHFFKDYNGPVVEKNENFILIKIK